MSFKAFTSGLYVCVAALALFAAPAAKAGPSYTTYTFTGDCTVDCVGQGTATVVLQNYTPGTGMVLANVVSLTYISDFLGTVNFNVTDVSGTFPIDSSLPDYLDIRFWSTNASYFFTGIDGLWCIGNRCAADAGNNGLWSAAVTTPEPGSIGLMVGGLGVLGWLARRRRS